MAIEVTYKNRKYQFGFTRQTAANLENSGFVLEQLGDKPNVMVPLLVYHAATAYNPKIKHKLVDEIYGDLKGDKEGFIMALVEEYTAPTATLFEDNEQGNATWKQV